MNSSSLLERMKILIVDDEPANVALLQEILLENGYARLESAGNSKNVLETYKKFQPDLVLLDLMMPPPDGFAILESLRAENGESFLPVVVLTADTSEETKRRALGAGATDFLCKPFDHTEVVLRIRNLLESRRVHLLLDNQRAALEETFRERTDELRATIAELQKANELPAHNV
jgi:putative two-component system response regulator